MTAKTANTSQASSAPIGTFAQTYGRFEIRCRVPAGRGLRAGFWLLPVPLGPLPEIDVFETAGSPPSKVFFANRWGTEQTERSFGDSFTGPDLSSGFHIIAIEWDRDRITWFVDGKEKFQSVDGVPRQADVHADRSGGRRPHRALAGRIHDSPRFIRYRLHPRISTFGTQDREQ